MRVKYRGTITEGMGCSNQTLSRQMNGMSQTVGPLRFYVPATINVRLDKPFRWSGYYVETPSIKWHDDYPAETFKLYPIRLEVNGQTVKAFVYRAQYTPHRVKVDYVEVLAPYVDFDKGMKCRVIQDAA